MRVHAADMFVERRNPREYLTTLQIVNDKLFADRGKVEHLESQVNHAAHLVECGIRGQGPAATVQLQNIFKSLLEDLLNLPYLM